MDGVCASTVSPLDEKSRQQERSGLLSGPGGNVPHRRPPETAHGGRRSRSGPHPGRSLAWPFPELEGVHTPAHSPSQDGRRQRLPRLCRNSDRGSETGWQGSETHTSGGAGDSSRARLTLGPSKESSSPLPARTGSTHRPASPLRWGNGGPPKSGRRRDKREGKCEPAAFRRRLRTAPGASRPEQRHSQSENREDESYLTALTFS